MCVTSVTLLLCLTVPLLSLFYELLCEDCTSLVANVSPDTVCSRRVCAVRVITNAWKLLLVNCYMPYEDDDAKFDDFVSELSVIEDLVNAHNDCRVMTCGYFNVDFSRTGLHTVLLKSFCETLNVASLPHKCQPPSPPLDNI